MPTSAIYDDLSHITLEEFSDIVVTTEIQRLPTGDPRKLRLHIIDKSYVDIFISVKGRYSYHWSRTLLGGGTAIYRHDNAPHKAWRGIATFPKHFHNGSESNVTDSHISDEPLTAVREFCTFIRQMLLKEPA